jgi:hypothetical protein
MSERILSGSRRNRNTATLDRKVCGIKGCDLRARSLGLCNKHWRQMKRYGSPLATRLYPRRLNGLSSEERFWMQVKKTRNCWLWTGRKDKNGYGLFQGEIHGVVYRKAHRYSWALHNDQPVPAGGQVCHACDNPPCVRADDHLFIGTIMDNMDDKIRKGRGRVAYGEKSGKAKLTEEQAKAIRLDPRTWAAIGADYNLAASTVGSIKQRISWRHLDVEVVKGKRPGPRRGVSDNITPEIVRTIRTSTERGRVLAKRYGVSEQTICDIRKRRSWKHID